MLNPLAATWNVIPVLKRLQRSLQRWRSLSLVLSGKVLLQVKKCADAGADMVRITVQGRQEAAACAKIREQLFKDRSVDVQHTYDETQYCGYCLTEDMTKDGHV